ncbi:MAG TPA: DEAD/DEAH box helicase family protein [Steroidobacteraceae bacterium]|nr:DEAD/DEAH box helicase family protein [Steroidobacteraceae bacterium]
MTETLERRPELGFASYDRMFPSQDTLPKGGFGNLIALPLQRRARDYGNSVFVDTNLLPYRDQWAFLGSLPRLTPQAAYGLIGAAEARDRVLSVRMPIADENGEEPWRRLPSRRPPPERVTEFLPSRVKIVLSDDIYIDRTALPPSMVARLIRLAAFQNPEFYRAQAMRLSTFGKPRIISCALLPGKTVVAAALIAHRQVNTLVLVHRKELLKQWVERLRQFLSRRAKLLFLAAQRFSIPISNIIPVTPSTLRASSAARFFVSASPIRPASLTTP